MLRTGFYSAKSSTHPERKIDPEEYKILKTGQSSGRTDFLIMKLSLPSFSTEDREMVTEALTSLKNTLDEALARAAKPSKMLA
jgi:hypothetical protein